VKALHLQVDGTSVEPTLETIRDGRYPLSRPLFLLTKGQPGGLAKEYIDFILSDEGQEIVARAEYIPLPS